MLTKTADPPDRGGLCLAFGEVEAIRGPLAEALSGIEPRSRVPSSAYSTVTESFGYSWFGRDYWYRNVRQTVLFDQAVRNACEQELPHVHRIQPASALITGVEHSPRAPTVTRRPLSSHEAWRW